jgi:hypothetical protein
MVVAWWWWTFLVNKFGGVLWYLEVGVVVVNE